MKLQSKHQPEFQEFDMPQVLGEHVCWVVITIDKEDLNLLVVDDFPDIMVANVDVLRPTLRYRVGANEDCSLVVTADWNGTELVADLFHEHLEPNYLATAIADRHILSFSG